ncbi:hypothetical protein [Enterococcus mundtii]|uniref:hypothetical protein n=1 Tax=Enterococcus mundtii TaxID=53346 RepID=UPI002DBE1844|nr:hypothetical protein [Enterococcus mundtii]MEC3940057.1 hypothetical protein [Enterococcus mundtii]
MELLVKETLALGKKRDILFPYYVGYTFFKENNYQGKITHKEAILAYLNYLSRLAKTNLWSSKKREETGKPVDCEMYVAKFRELNSDSIIYTEIDPTTLNLGGYPIEVNEEMMEGTELTAEDLFMEGGVYEEAFFNEFHGTNLSKTDFNLVNQRFFPLKDKLIIYSWNTEFTKLLQLCACGLERLSLECL